MPLLYDQFGRPIERKRVPDRRPLAVAPLLDSFRDYVTDGLTPETLASVFKEADQGDVRRQSELFDQLEEKDAHLLCERDKRKNIILALDFEIEPASDSSRDGLVAEFVEDFFNNMADWDDCLTSLQDAVGKGFAALETYWDVSSDQALPEKFEFLEQKRFSFTDGTGKVRRYPRLLSDEHQAGEEIPAWKVVLHQYGGKSGNANRAGIYRVASWMILFKHYSLKDWVIFAEVFGMPLRLGRYDQGATQDDKDALIAAISSLGTDAAGIISKSTEIDFIETIRQASGELYQTLADFCDGQVSKAILGQTLSADVGEHGSYAASQTHDGIRLDLLKADGRAASATVRGQIIRPIVGFNFGWDTPLPTCISKLTTPGDLNKKSEWMEKVTSKVAVPKKWYLGQFDIPEGKDGEEMVGGPDQQPFPQPGRIVTAKNQPPPVETSPAAGSIDRLTEQALESTDLAEILDPVKQMMDESETLEEFRAKLLEAGDSLPVTELAAIMQKAFFLAELSGRFDADPKSPE